MNLYAAADNALIGYLCVLMSVCTRGGQRPTSAVPQAPSTLVAFVLFETGSLISLGFDKEVITG